MYNINSANDRRSTRRICSLRLGWNFKESFYTSDWLRCLFAIQDHHAFFEALSFPWQPIYGSSRNSLSTLKWRDYLALYGYYFCTWLLEPFMVTSPVCVTFSVALNCRLFSNMTGCSETVLQHSFDKIKPLTWILYYIWCFKCCKSCVLNPVLWFLPSLSN